MPTTQVTITTTSLVYSPSGLKHYHVSATGKMQAKINAQQTILTFSIASRVSLVLLGLVFYLVRRDLSKKAAEAEVRQLNQTLEQRVYERTSQLEAANQEMQAFSYSVSHDLRAPLRAMQGFAQALLEDYSEQLDKLGQEYADPMENLIQDLLAYSRLSGAEIGLQSVNLTAP